MSSDKHPQAQFAQHTERVAAESRASASEYRPGDRVEAVWPWRPPLSGVVTDYFRCSAGSVVVIEGEGRTWRVDASRVRRTTC